MVAVAITIVVLVAVLLRLTLIAPFTVPSSAMAPTLQAGDRILVLRSSFLTGSIGRGDIIVFHRPSYFPLPDLGHSAIPRATGDRLAGRDDLVESPNHLRRRKTDRRAWMVRARPRRSELCPDHEDDDPQGRLLRPGDNRTNSCDSRSFGAIPAPRPSARSLPSSLATGPPTCTSSEDAAPRPRVGVACAGDRPGRLDWPARTGQPDLRSGRHSARSHPAASRSLGRRPGLGLVGGLPARASHGCALPRSGTGAGQSPAQRGRVEPWRDHAGRG